MNAITLFSFKQLVMSKNSVRRPFLFYTPSPHNFMIGSGFKIIVNCFIIKTGNKEINCLCEMSAIKIKVKFSTETEIHVLNVVLTGVN